MTGFTSDADLNGLWTLAMASNGTVAMNHDYPYYKQRVNTVYLTVMETEYILSEGIFNLHVVDVAQSRWTLGD